MDTGQVISGVGHLGVIGLALFGGVFQSEPLPFEVTEVTSVSTEEYAALIARQQAPDAVANVDTPEPPEVGGGAPELSSQVDDTPATSQPDIAEEPPSETVPEIENEPIAEAEIADETPVLDPPSEDVAALLPQPDARPQVRPAERVAPEPVAQPEPDVRIDEIEQAETAPSPEETPVEDVPEETAPEEAAAEIVTEAEEIDEPEVAPARSVRPRTRPAQQEVAETPKPELEPEAETTPSAQSPDRDALKDALNEALGEETSDARPAGPPLTGGETEAFRLAVQDCWVIDPGSRSANVVVTIAFELTREGKVEGSLRQLSAVGGDDAAQRVAFESARRAILRCQRGGYKLPTEKYEHWREVELTFNPEKTRSR